MPVLDAELDRAAHQEHDDADGSSDDPPPAEVPTWWLCFLPLYWFPQRINWGLIQTYLLPFQVSAIVGDKHKHMAYSMMIVSSNVGSMIGPVWGALSDRAVDSNGRRMRRPMVVVGQLLFCLACLLMCEAKTFVILMLSFMLYTLTATISGAPYTSVYTLVPTGQRGTLSAIEGWQTLFVSVIVSALGVGLGKATIGATATLLAPSSTVIGDTALLHI